MVLQPGLNTNKYDSSFILKFQGHDIYCLSDSAHFCHKGCVKPALAVKRSVEAGFLQPCGEQFAVCSACGGSSVANVISPLRSATLQQRYITGEDEYECCLVKICQNYDKQCHKFGMRKFSENRV